MQRGDAPVKLLPTRTMVWLQSVERDISVQILDNHLRESCIERRMLIDTLAYDLQSGVVIVSWPDIANRPQPVGKTPRCVVHDC